MQEMTRRAAITDPPFIPPPIRKPDPVMLLLHRFEGLGEMIDRTTSAQRIYEASDCLEPEERPGVEAAIGSAVDDSKARLSNAEIELFSTRATSYEGVLGKARYAWYLAANTTEEQVTGPLGDRAILWSILQDLEGLAGEG